MALRHVTGWAIGAALLALAAPALADVKAGVDAWSKGDWAGAVAAWQEPAAANDPDALFNLGQAYRLGRGVAKDDARAEAYYLKAAQLGHIQAADTYGLMLFQQGRKQEAMPYVQDAARRGDPRAEYLLGIAHFNGDIVGKDWVRAYALVSLANSQGLPQAAPALAQMDGYIPYDQRQQAAQLALQLQNDADAARAREMAAADLARDTGAAEEASAPAQPGGAFADASSSLPRKIQQVDVDPSVVAARAAVAEAVSVTGTESPADAGADYARPRSSTPPVAVAAAQPAPARPAPPAAPPPASTASGPWKLQLGAFGVPGNAEKLWASLAARPELAGKSRLLVPAGKLTKLLAGGYASEADATAACRRLQQAGQACIVTR